MQQTERLREQRHPKLWVEARPAANMDRALAAALKALREPRAQAEAWARRLTQALGVVVKQVAAGGRGAARRGRGARARRCKASSSPSSSSKRARPCCSICEKRITPKNCPTPTAVSPRWRHLKAWFFWRSKCPLPKGRWCCPPFLPNEPFAWIKKGAG